MRHLDSGLMVVVLIILTMIIILIYCLLFVKYEWCPVLFANNTVSQTSTWFHYLLNKIEKMERNRK